VALVSSPSPVGSPTLTGRPTSYEPGILARITARRELILGGDGLIGSALGAELRARGHAVESLDLRTGCDLRHVGEEPFLRSDRVWFLAWDTGGAKYLESTDRQHAIYKHNCELSIRVFDCLLQTERPFLFVTSQLAGVRNAYGMSKLLAEAWADQLGGKIARLWNVFGWEAPGERSHVIPDFVLSGLATGRIECLTDGSELRRQLYKTDCVEGLIQLFDGDSQRADLCGERWISVGEMASMVAELVGAEVRLGSAKGSELLIDPANRLSGWAPAVSLTEGISLVIEEARRYVNADRP
jgi:nucleoside-diphosphate-sugar epimerase